MPRDYRSETAKVSFSEMISAQDEMFGLEVKRADLHDALKLIARMNRQIGETRLSFESDRLVVSANETSVDIPASGKWPHPVYVGGSWIRVLVKNMPGGDPIRIWVEQNRIHANGHAQSCSRQPEGFEGQGPGDTGIRSQEVADKLKDELIGEAARILKPLKIDKASIEALVSVALARGSCSWSQGVRTWTADEKKAAKLIEGAWFRLAPFGVGMTEIHELMNRAIHQAWRRK